MDSVKGLIKQCKTHFGTTKNPFDAGYIMSDGSMLDFKRTKPTHKGGIIHSQIAECMPEYGEMGISEGINKFMKGTGSLRVEMAPRKPYSDEEFTHFEGVANVKPTAAQARILGKRCREHACSWNIRRPDSTNCEWSPDPTSWSEYMRAFERCKRK